MKFRVGACALLVCLAGCTAEAPDTKFGDQKGAASASARTAQRLPPVQAGRQSSQSVANAPDRGELISYKNKGAAIKREGAYTWYPVAISEAHALKAVVDGVMSIPSPDGSQVKVRYERHVEHPDGNWTWIGRVIGGDQKQEAILTFGEKAVYGSIPQTTGAPLSLQTRGGQLYAVQTDLSKVKNPNSRTDMMVPPALALRSALLKSAPKAQVSQSAVETKAATPASTVDVAIGYTAGFATAQGSQSAAVTRLVFLVDVGNQAFTNSLINGALRLVSAVQVDYTDTTTNKAALGELTGHNGNSSGNTSVPIPASLVPLRTARDQYGADLAVLVRKFQTPENVGCGIAWLNGSGGVPIDPATDDDFGFAVISDGNDSEGANTYFCADETLVHELGHLMGSAHDRDNSKIDPDEPPGGTNLLYGRYPYSFGMKTTEATGNFYTIMAYGDNNQNFYRTFSNPLVVKCGPSGNLACGVTDQTDNARSLNQTIPVVATFRASLFQEPKLIIPGEFNGDGRSDVIRVDNGSQVKMWLKTADNMFAEKIIAGFPAGWEVVGAGDVDLDGKSDLFWYHPSSGALNYWLLNESGVRSYVDAGPLAVGFTVRAIKDFNGDGRSDVLISNGSSLRIRFKNAAAGFTETAVPLYPAGWNLAGAQDVDGDGKADLFWHNSSTGALDYWLMDGVNVRSFVAGGVMTLGYTVRAIADFNGDNRPDVAWSDGNTDVRMWIKSAAAGFTAATVSGYPAGWNLAGAGDVNGDGRADLFWHQPSTGMLHYWLMNGAAVQSFVASAPSIAPYSPRAFGDISGDGRQDVIWSDGTSNVRTWVKNAGAGYVDRSISGYPAGWSIVGLGDVDLDGREDLFWYHASTGGLNYWLLNENGVRSFVDAGPVAAGYTVRAIEDFNADGRADVLLSNGGSLRIRFKNAGSGFTESAVPLYPPGWNLVGAADVDGDGSADLIWHNTSNNALDYWLMNGVTIRSFVSGGTMTAGYTVRAVGDFNGDNRADLLWSNGATDVRMWLKTAAGNGFTSATVSGYPASWNVASAGDVDADGKDDILWYQPSSSILHYWLMDGSAIRSFVAAGSMP